jgi:hypothetical protein
MAEPAAGRGAAAGQPPPDWAEIVRTQQETIDDLTAALEAQQKAMDEMARRLALLAPPPSGSPDRPG